MQKADAELTTSPHPTDSHDHDATQTHFHLEAFRSPDKRFPEAQTDSLKPAVPTPLRRSPRHSTPLVSKVIMERLEQETSMEMPDAFDSGAEAGPSRARTPDLDPSPEDEPSSVLASRIMRAHDNPSPPPSSPQDMDGYPLPLRSLESTATKPTPCPDGLNQFSSLVLTDSSREEHHNERIPQPLFGIESISPTQSRSTSPFPEIPDCDIPPTASSSLNLAVATDPEGGTHRPQDTPMTFPASPSPLPHFTSDSDEDRMAVEASLTPKNSQQLPTQPEVEEPSPVRRSGRARRRPSQFPAELTAAASPSRLRTVTPEFSAAQLDFGGDFMMNDPVRDQTVVTGGRKGKGVPSRRVLGTLSPGSSRALAELHPGLSVTGDKTEECKTQETPEAPSQAGPSTFNPSLPIRFPNPKHQPVSPTKFRLDMGSPARRIPIEEAVAQGSMSPERAKQLSRSGSSSAGATTGRLFNIPPTDSPARRVPIPPHLNMPKPQKPLWGAARSGSPTRSRSVEPVALQAPKPRPRSGSVEPSSRTARLPAFPSRSNAIPSSPAQSQTRLPFPLVPQPTIAEETEDAPRTSAMSLASPSKLQTSTLKQPTSRIPRIATTPYARPTASVSKVPASKITNKTPAIPAQRKTLLPVSRTAVSGPGPSTTLATLKRKRVDTLGSPTEPRTGFPIRSARSVAPPTQSTGPPSAMLGGSPVKFHSVELQLPQPIVKAPPPPHTAEADVAMPLEQREFLTSESPFPDLLVNIGTAEPMVITEESELDTRRTTRSRRSGAAPDIRPIPSRRRPPVFQDTGPFSTMSAMALKALTNNNTVKNQHYLTILLQKEIVRKDGERPDSPVMKVKSISQKREEDKEKLRGERAARRTKRNEQGDGYSSPAEGEDEEIDQLDSSPLRHKRGPGEEEDYETPLRHLKRDRSDESGDVDMEKKRVKWDRGLWTEVFLDDIQPRTKACVNEDLIPTKGCLAPTAKALPLDTLGNLNTELPINVVQENIVVKKFVYDDDAELELPEPPPPPPPKSTRSKAKKGKP